MVDPEYISFGSVATITGAADYGRVQDILLFRAIVSPLSQKNLKSTNGKRAFHIGPCLCTPRLSKQN